MKKNLLLKVLVLTSFIALIGLFLLYRIGYFNEQINKATNNIGNSPNDSTTAHIVKDTPKKTMLSSSKSIVVTDNIDNKPIDINKAIYGIKLKKKDTATKPVVTSVPANKEDISLISSSKSGVIVDPIQSKNDSTLFLKLASPVKKKQ